MCNAPTEKMYVWKIALQVNVKGKRIFAFRCTVTVGMPVANTMIRYYAIVCIHCISHRIMNVQPISI